MNNHFPFPADKPPPESGMTAVGHEDRFRPLRLSAGSRLGLPTFSWTHNRVREAPIAGAQGPFIARCDRRGRYLARSFSNPSALQSSLPNPVMHEKQPCRGRICPQFAGGADNSGQINAGTVQRTGDRNQKQLLTWFDEINTKSNMLFKVAQRINARRPDRIERCSLDYHLAPTASDSRPTISSDVTGRPSARCPNWDQQSNQGAVP
jgi:hypothetical protein